MGSAQIEDKELQDLITRFKAILKFVNTILNRKGSEKINMITTTWNPITGCTHLCRYCWAYKLVEGTLRRASQRYRQGFKPTFHPGELKRGFKDSEIVFVVNMGDMFSSGVKDEWIVQVLKHIRRFPRTLFLLLTKNPARYRDFMDLMAPNMILGVTIETNRDDLYLRERISRAPLPSERYKAMKEIEWPMKYLSIEPILDFDLDVFVRWIKDVNPFLVYVGYDNYNNRLPEPSIKKTLRLINAISDYTLIAKGTIRPAWYEKGSMLRYINK